MNNVLSWPRSTITPLVTGIVARKGAFVNVSVMTACFLLGAAPNPAGPDPYEIYEKAREVWSAQVFPTPLQYRISISASDGQKAREQHFHAEIVDKGDIRVEGISDEEDTHPHQATGINTYIHFELKWEEHAGGGTLISRDTKTGRKEATPDLLGVPLISPVYGFGMELPQISPAPSASPGNSSLRTIAILSTSDRAYDVTLIGREIVAGFDTYHLALKPRREPARYRLRELWVDAYTCALIKLVTQGNFVNSPEKDVAWSVTFQNVGGLTYVDTETAEGPLVFKHDRTFARTSVSFDQIQTADSTLPVLPSMDTANTLQEPR